MLFKAVVGSPAGPAMILNLHQVSNRLTFESIPSVHSSINNARLEFILSHSSFDCGIAV